jgi:2-dehydro-3-deoxygluconokinase
MTGSARRILCIGECMVEMAPTGEPGTFRMGFAGDTMNTAWYLRRRLPGEWAVDYLTAVGTDGVSDRMVAFLAEAGIGTGHIARRADRTVGLYLIELGAGGERSFAYWRGQSAARTLAADPAALAAGLDGARLAYLSGITLAILPEGDRARLLDTLAAFRAGGGLVAFDPNLRPRLWASGEAMCAAVMQAAAVADIALPSFEDEARWFGDADPAATLARYGGVATVVVKDGAGPVLWRDAGVTGQHATAPVPQVVDTTAAGDGFNAGFLAARLVGAGMGSAVAEGAALAARVIGGRGALVPVD